MAQPSKRPRRSLARSVIVGGLSLLFVLAWIGIGLWNAVKPLPAGVRSASQTTRLAESEIEWLLGGVRSRETMTRELRLIDRAEQLIIIDQSPVEREISQALLLRQQARPHLKIIVLTDPRHPAFGGTSAADLTALERGGIIVVRVRLESLRDSNPLYTALWRMAVQWWSDPFTERAGAPSVQVRSRQLNCKADRRQVLVADDGTGTWTSIMGAAAGDVGLVLRGAPAHDIIAGELQIAAWSSDDDRLPGAPPARSRGIGTIDTRYLSEGAIAASLLEAFDATLRGDLIAIDVINFGHRRLLTALAAAAARGVSVQILLDDGAAIPNHGAAVALERESGGRAELRWNRSPHAPAATQLVMIRHRGDAVLYAISASLTRRQLDDFDLTSAAELRLPARAATARALFEYFAAAWGKAATTAFSLDDPDSLYWRYRFAEGSGLSDF